MAYKFHNLEFLFSTDNENCRTARCDISNYILKLIELASILARQTAEHAHTFHVFLSLINKAILSRFSLIEIFNFFIFVG